MTQDPEYPQQLDAKVAALREACAGLVPPRIEIFPSPPWHFRMRAEFRIWHEGDRSHYAMTPPGGDKPAPIADFAIGSAPMVAAMGPLLTEIIARPLLRRKLYAAEFLTTRDGQVLATLIYHRPLGDEWLAAAREVQAQLGIELIGRSRKQKLAAGRDYVVETFNVNGRQLHYQQVESGFTQPNAAVNERMLNWAVDVTRHSAGDLLELYCGNGNFTIALAENFRRVLATEISRTSVASANVNLEANGVTNAHVARMSAEEFALALKGEKEGRRVAEMALDEYDFSTVLVDPPRAGLDEQSCQQISEYAQIVYISCNPATLAENLTLLTKTHDIERFALFDQFPFTHHCECGVLLTRRQPQVASQS